MSAVSPCIYYKTHCTCSSTASLLIFILINDLHIVINSDIFSDFPLNTCGIATSALDPVLSLETFAIFSIFLFASVNVWGYAVILAICSWYFWIICNWLIPFSKDIDVFIGREEGPMLVPLSELNSSINISVNANRSFSSLISYYLLTTYLTTLLTTVLIKLLYYYS